MTPPDPSLAGPSPWRRRRLSNGLVVLARQESNIPLASAVLIWPVGSLAEKPSEAGLCSFTTELLLHGTRRRSARRIASALESVGGSMGTHTTEDYSEIGWTAPDRYAESILDVFADVLRNPVFPEDEIAKERAHILADLKSRHDSLFTLAHDRLSQTLFGAHPYGRDVEGVRATISRFRADDLRAWHRNHLHPQGAIFALISPSGVSRTLRRVEAALGAWRRPTGAASPPTALTVPPMLRDRRVHASSAFQQAYLMTGAQAPSVHDPEFLPLKLFNVAVGGGMSSRLFTVLREQCGLAYEVSSFYPAHFQTSQWVAYLGLPGPKLAAGEKRLDALLRVIARQGLRKEEISQAKQMLKGAFLMDYQTRRRQVWYVAWWELLGKGADYGRHYARAIDEVRPDDVQRAARHVLGQPRATVLVMPKARA